ncbi:MAG TPA: GrpB family protein [Gaiellaceae bacterium]
MSSRDPNDVAAYDADLARVTLGGPQPLTTPIEIVEYDPEWPVLYEREEERIRSVLGDRVVRIEHAGSTSVPGLAAKPRVDILLEVADTADEPSYVPDLEAAGYVLRVREPDWFEHRVFKGPDTDVNLHVFPAGCPEVDAMLLFRDHLRANARDRELYAAAKRELAARDWKYMQQYADAKTDVVRAIMARAARTT